MEHRIFKCLCLLWTLLFVVSLKSTATADNLVVNQDSSVSMRFGAQWEISKGEKQSLDQKFGINRVSFDLQGRPVPKGISPKVVQRWYRLYNLCMSDGCYYCDAAEGSCETGTCGPNNSQCKPHMDSTGCPKCGPVCADYAFTATLH